MEMFKRVAGEKHPDTLISINNLAFTLKSQSRNKEAISLMEKCVQLQKRILGPHHPNTEASLKTLNEWADGERGDGTLKRLYFVGPILITLLGIAAKRYSSK